MNILFLSDVYFPRINGVSTSIHTLRGQLVEMGHQVHMMAPDYFSPTEDESWITRVPACYLPFDPEDRLMRYGKALEIAASSLRTDFDLIHVHTPFAAHYMGLKLAKRYGIPCVETYHTFFEDYMHHYLPVLPKFFLKRVARGLSRRQCNAMSAVVAPSQPMLDALRGYGVRTEAEVIPTGLEEHSFERGNGVAFRQRYDLPESRPILLFVGRVAHEKNIGFLLRMMVELKQTHPEALLVIAGEGPALESVKHDSRKLGLQDQVRFLGYLDRRAELNDCYSAADVFVFSSLTETQGLVLLEAMAQGVPVVAIAEMGTKSILKEGVGALISSQDESVFAGRVRRLLVNPGERAQIGQAAARYAREWSASTMAQRMVDFYRKLIKS